MREAEYDEILDEFKDVIDDEPAGLALLHFDEADCLLKYATRLPIEEEDLLDYLISSLERRKNEISETSFRVDGELW